MDEFKAVINDVVMRYMKYIKKRGRQWLDQPVDTLVGELLDEFDCYGESPDDDPEDYKTLCDLILKALMLAERIRTKCDFTRCDHGMGMAGGGGCPGEPTDAECKAFTREYSEAGTS